MYAHVRTKGIIVAVILGLLWASPVAAQYIKKKKQKAPKSKTQQSSICTRAELASVAEFDEQMEGIAKDPGDDNRKTIRFYKMMSDEALVREIMTTYLKCKKFAED